MSVIPLPRPDPDRNETRSDPARVVSDAGNIVSDTGNIVSDAGNIVSDAGTGVHRVATHAGVDSGRSRELQARIASREIAPAGDESELAHRLAAGDPAALTAITEWLWEPLAAYAYRLVEDRDAARDIAQEACVRLWQRRGHDSPRSVRPYLFRVVRNLALDHLKTRRARRRLLQRQEPGRTRRPARPDEVMESDRVASTVQQSIQDLPDRRREVFVLAYLRGLSYADIGEVLGISPKTVQNQMTAALAQLRTTLRPLLDERRTAAGRSQ